MKYSNIKKRTDNENDSVLGSDPNFTLKPNLDIN